MTRLRLLMLALTAAAAAAFAIGAGSAAEASYPGVNGPILFHYRGNIWKTSGGGASRITNYSDADVSSPAVSPNGKRLAVTVDPAGGTSEIYTADLKGKHVKWVTKKLSKSGKFLSFRSPAWSKNGKRLVFLCNSFSKHELCTTKTNGKGFKYVTHCECVNTGASDAPDVSKRNQVVWAYSDKLYTKPLKGGSPKVIATASGEDTFFEYPSWSPDGNQIAVQLNDTNSAIDVMNADGSARHRIAQSPDFSQDRTSYTDPAWAPDGTRIGLVVAGLGPSQGGKVRGIYTMNTDGSDLQPVFIPQGDDFDQYVEIDWARKHK